MEYSRNNLLSATIRRGGPDLIDLPSDHARPATASHRGDVVEFTVPGAVHLGLRGLARESGASLFMVVQACLAGLLTRLGAGTDIAIGSPIAGRGDAALEDCVGFFVNTLVLRTDTSGNPRVVDLIGRVRSGNLSAYGHADVPFERVVEAVNPSRSLSRHPLFQVMLAFQTEVGSSVRLGDAAGRFEAVSTGSAKFDLSVSVSEADGGLSGVVEYASDLFERGSIERLTARFVRLLGDAASRPEARLGELSVLSSAEREELVEDWASGGSGAGGSPAEGAGFGAGALSGAGSFVSVVDVIAGQVGRTPEAVAVMAGATPLTYRALDVGSNRVAHRLRQCGVGPETIVGVCLDRSADLIVSLLGVLKAGGAYLPLDPAYPRERLALMVADAGVSLIVSAGSAARVAQELAQDLAAQEGAPASPALASVSSSSSSSPSSSSRASDVAVSAHAGSALAGDAARGGVRVLRLDDGAEIAALAEAPSHAPEIALDPRHPAYVIYTSGSTGTPKGVVVAHRGLPNLAAAQIERFAIGPSSRVLQFASASFDAAVSEMVTALCSGATLVVPTAAELDDVLGTLAAQGITHATLPPALVGAWPEDLAATLPLTTLVDYMPFYDEAAAKVD